MPTQLNRPAFEKLIAENIEAMELCKPCFVENQVRLEWDHIVECLRELPELYYGVVGCGYPGPPGLYRKRVG